MHLVRCCKDILNKGYICSICNKIIKEKYRINHTHCEICKYLTTEKQLPKHLLTHKKIV